VVGSTGFEPATPCAQGRTVPSEMPIQKQCTSEDRWANISAHEAGNWSSLTASGRDSPSSVVPHDSRVIALTDRDPNAVLAAPSASSS
jgi:hypothetical protein